MTQVLESPVGASAELGRVSHWIDGQIVPSTSGHSAPVFNPATGQQTKTVDLASAEEVDAAVAAAKAAFPAWRATSLSKRSDIMFRIRNAFHDNRDQMAALLTSEHGKVLSDAAGEVARGLENIEFALRRAAADEGRVQRAGFDRRGRLPDPSAVGRRGRHHALQLPGHGADVDVRQRHRHWQHVRAQALRAPTRRPRYSWPS